METFAKPGHRAPAAPDNALARDRRMMEMKRPMPLQRPDHRTTAAGDPLGRELGDWWRVAAMVAAVLGGCALILYALVEWATGM